MKCLFINCEINCDLNCSKNCIVAVTDLANQVKTFAITDAKLYVPVVTLSTRDNKKLLEHLKSGFKRTINWNKYQSKKSTERPNQYLDYLIDASFPRVNKLVSFVPLIFYLLSFYHLKMKQEEPVTNDIIFQL